MVQVEISSCTAKIGGGAVAVVSEGPSSNVGTVNITKTVISHCEANLGGGGVLVLSLLNGMVRAVDVSHVVISDSSAASESGNQVRAFGGGIFVLSLSESMIDTVNIADLSISRCNATTGAGGMLFWADEKGVVGSVQIDRCKLQSCNCLSAGGGVFGSQAGGTFSGSIVVQGSVFRDCHALDTPWYSGDFEPTMVHLSGQPKGMFYPQSGGLLIFGTVGLAVEISNSSFQRCSALNIDGWGGGLALGAITGMVAPSVVVQGVLAEHCASFLGGGIFAIGVMAPSFSILDSVVRNNNATLGGGAGIWTSAVSVGPNVSISSNIAIGGGGGIALYGSSMTMGASSNRPRVEVRGNRALGELNISQSGWIKKIRHAALKSDIVSFSAQGGGILVLSVGGQGPVVSRLDLLPGVSIVGNTAGVGGGVALATAQPVTAESPKSIMTASGTLVTTTTTSSSADSTTGSFSSTTTIAATSIPVIIADNTAVDNGDSINFKVVFQVFKIAGGDPDVPWGDGGGVWALDSSTVTLKSHVQVQGNHASRGGGISLNLGSMLVTDGTSFSQNVATLNGGAVSSLLGVSISATRTHFTRNSAGSFGGSLATDLDSSSTLTECLLQQNVAVHGGGGLSSMADSSISLVACSLVGNEAKRDGGGALIAGYSTVTAVGGLFANNFVGRDGAGLAVVDSASFSAEGAEVIELRNNSASQDGGAMLFSSDGVVKLSSQMIRISSNSARRGGGICFVSGLEMTGSAATKIESNTASGMGGGLFGYGTPARTKSCELVLAFKVPNQLITVHLCRPERGFGYLRYTSS